MSITISRCSRCQRLTYEEEEIDGEIHDLGCTNCRFKLPKINPLKAIEALDKKFGRGDEWKKKTTNLKKQEET